jgi:hypothetical protein
VPRQPALVPNLDSPTQGFIIPLSQPQPIFQTTNQNYFLIKHPWGFFSQTQTLHTSNPQQNLVTNTHIKPPNKKNKKKTSIGKILNKKIYP